MRTVDGWGHSGRARAKHRLIRLIGVAPGSEWILHGCDFGYDSDVNFRCEDLTEDSAWM